MEEENDEEKELDQIPAEYDLNINIEKELDKITQNIPLTESVKISSIKSQVSKFFDTIPVVGQSDSVVKPLPSPTLNVAIKEEEDPPN